MKVATIVIIEAKWSYATIKDSVEDHLLDLLLCNFAYD